MLQKITLIVAFLLVLFFPLNAQAASPDTNKVKFATTYDVLYDVGEDGVTNVTEHITFKNLTSEYYANQFKLTIGATQVFDIKASDQSGPLTIQTEQKDNTIAINVSFNQQVAGLGKILPWIISFKSKDFAEKAGKVWEVRVPRVSSSANLTAYNLTISVPQSFGEVSAVSPTPKSKTSSNGKTFLTFDMDQLKESGVSASFGNYQLFNFDLTYHLENPNLMPALFSVALPPDTSFQDVIYQSMEPKPLNVTVDQDGNYLAWFRVNRKQKLEVNLSGSAKLYTISKVRNPALSGELKKKYTDTQQYWEKDNPQIVSKLEEILGSNPPADTEEKVKLIFNYVVDNLKYDSSRLKGNLERMGAVTALNNSDSAVCMEFTDLFIALARAAGIPARELDGYAYTANPDLRPLSLTKDILHAWPEYWSDKKGWVMVDPTWQNTTGGVDYFNKLDLNHFVFAIKGSSSSEPAPAGSYKLESEETHDVKVALSDKDFLGHPELQVQIETPIPLFSGFPSRAKLKIVNIGNASYPPSAITIGTNQLNLNFVNKASGVIPAFGKAEFDFNLRTNSLFDSYNDPLVIMVGNQKFTKEIAIKPFLLFRPVSAIVGAVVALIVLIYLSVLGFHLYRRRK